MRARRGTVAPPSGAVLQSTRSDWYRKSCRYFTMGGFGHPVKGTFQSCCVGGSNCYVFINDLLIF